MDNKEGDKEEVTGEVDEEGRTGGRGGRLSDDNGVAEHRSAEGGGNGGGDFRLPTRECGKGAEEKETGGTTESAGESAETKEAVTGSTEEGETEAEAQENKAPMRQKRNE